MSRQLRWATEARPSLRAAPPSLRARSKTLFCLFLACLAALFAHATEWVRPGINSGPGLWGIEGGLQFAIHPFGFTGGDGGPRGLIRLGYPVLEDGAYDLINFIAVEPVAGGQKGFSELEQSELDNVQGKRFWTDDPEDPGNLWSPDPGVEQLDVLIRVEKFLNGAHVYLIVSQRTDKETRREGITVRIYYFHVSKHKLFAGLYLLVIISED